MKRVLIDSHAFIWFVEDDPALSAAARLAIEQADVAWVSLASAWELALKAGKGKLTNKKPLQEAFRIAMDDSGLQLLPIDLSHALAVGRLPKSVHADPFDRVIVVQALALDATLVSADVHLDAYGVRRVW